MFPVEAEAVHFQCLGNILQESAEKTKQDGQQTSIAAEGFRQTVPGSARPAPASHACSSVVGKVIDEPGRDVQLGDFLQPSDTGGPPKAHPAEL